MKNERVFIGSVFALVLGCFALASSNTWASNDSEQVNATQKFTIENMTCASCPITVRTAMARVDGVREVTIDYPSKTATAIYDPSVTTTEAIAAASTKIGYPASAVVTSE